MFFLNIIKDGLNIIEINVTYFAAFANYKCIRIINQKACVREDTHKNSFFFSGPLREKKKFLH